MFFVFLLCVLVYTCACLNFYLGLLNFNYELFITCPTLLATNSLSFVYLEVSFFHLHFWKHSFAVYKILRWAVFPSPPVLWICYFTAFWPSLFLRSWLYFRFPCMWRYIFFLLSRFSLGFNIFTVFCLDVDLFEFILLGVCLASWLHD